MTTLACLLVALALLPFALWTAWLWLLALRSMAPRVVLPRSEAQPYFAIIVPAHDEVTLIARTVGYMRAFDYPQERYSIHVVADNCSDATHRLAIEAGAICHERNSETRRGKSYALQYGLEAVRDVPYDAVLFFDADSSPSSDYLQVMARHIAAGEGVVQGCYDVEAPDRNWFTRLTSVSFVLRNRWIFPAMDALGICIPLRGSGMCFPREVMERVGWCAHGLTEDAAMTLHLLEQGQRVFFAPLAVCQQYMPPTPAAARSQRLRWSAGESAMRGRLTKSLIGALERRHMRTAAAMILMLMPAFSVQLCAVVGLTGVAWLLPWQWLFAGALTVWLAYTGYFLLGFRTLDKTALAAIAMLPIFALWRSGMAIKGRFRKPQDWVRTARR